MSYSPVADKIDCGLWAILRKLAVTPPFYSQSGKHFRKQVSKPDDHHRHYLQSNLFFLKIISKEQHFTWSPLWLKTTGRDVFQMSSNTNISFKALKLLSSGLSQWSSWIDCLEDKLLLSSVQFAHLKGKVVVAIPWKNLRTSLRRKLPISSLLLQDPERRGKCQAASVIWLKKIIVIWSKDGLGPGLEEKMEPTDS